MGIFRRKRRIARPRAGPSLPPNRRRKRAADDNRRRGSAKPKRDRKRLRRVLLALVKLFVAGAITGLAVWGGIMAYRHATTAAYFAVDTIEIEGATRLSEAEILAAAGVEPGMNVFAVDVDDAASRLGSHPWVAEAEVTRRLPRSVAIQVLERKVEALVLFDVPYLVDDSGEVFKRWALGDPRPRPLLTGFSREEFAVDGDDVRAGIRDAISLARRYRAAGIERRAPLAEIHREIDGSFSLTIGDDPFYVRFGKGPYRKKLKRLAALLVQISRDGERPAMVFFDNEVRPDRVTVKVKPKDTTPAAEVVDGTLAQDKKTSPKI